MAEHVHRLFGAEECLQLVERVMEARRLRACLFEPGLFSDPAWDILLNLYSSELRHQDLTVDELAAAIGLSRAATTRWFDVLAGQGFIRLLSASEDHRRQVELTAKGVSGMRRWSALWLNGDSDAVGGLLDRMLSYQD